MCGSRLSSVCGSRTEAMQSRQTKNILKSVAAVIHKNKRNAVGNSEKAVHLCVNYRSVIHLAVTANEAHFCDCCRCQAKFPTSAKFLTCYFLSIIVLLRIKK